MKPVIIGNATLYHGDCLEILPTLDRVDAVITDPPYELSDSGPGKSHYGMSLKKFDSGEYKNIVNGFNVVEVFDLIKNIVNPFNIFCFCSNKQISKIMTYGETAGLSTTLLIWNKVNAAPFANGVWRGDAEFIVHIRGKGAYFEGNAEQKRKVSQYPIVNDKDHPTVKPLGLIEKYTQICSCENELILDPFMGSGTTGVACMNLGRKFIGIEKEKKYFDIACERIDQAQKQVRLFE